MAREALDAGDWGLVDELRALIQARTVEAVASQPATEAEPQTGIFDLTNFRKAKGGAAQ